MEPVLRPRKPQWRSREIIFDSLKWINLVQVWNLTLCNYFSSIFEPSWCHKCRRNQLLLRPSVTLQNQQVTFHLPSPVLSRSHVTLWDAMEGFTQNALFQVFCSETRSQEASEINQCLHPDLRINNVIILNEAMQRFSLIMWIFWFKSPERFKYDCYQMTVTQKTSLVFKGREKSLWSLWSLWSEGWVIIPIMPFRGSCQSAFGLTLVLLW